MEEIIDLIATDGPASEISDKIKEVLFAKAGERVVALKPSVGNAVFDGTEVESEEE